MTTRMIRQSTLVRRGQITEAARHLITTYGMEAVTIDSIAEAVGLTEGAIYRHFTSKHQILTLLIDDIEKNLLDTVLGTRVEGTSALKNLELILHAHLSDVEESRAASFVIITEAMGFDGIGLGPRVSLMLTHYLAFIRGVLELGMKEGDIRHDLDVPAAATAFLGLIQSTATLWALNNHEPPLAERRVQMWDIFRRGIASKD
ncbi:TetR/AcrR family transcriptional regulator [SAR202 cluster bacterium AC-647-N09_OGT_505m]|nr:TetR/AcrR family transcriptional regulator [SAR202 cluster bacterium AC-647-N09_OGT_505m]